MAGTIALRMFSSRLNRENETILRPGGFERDDQGLILEFEQRLAHEVDCLLASPALASVDATCAMTRAVHVLDRERASESSDSTLSLRTSSGRSPFRANSNLLMIGRDAAARPFGWR